MSTYTCGKNVTCSSNQFCYLSSYDGPSCELKGSRNKPWMLDNSLFPPIRYIGNIRGEGLRSSCELLNCSRWTYLNKTWLIDYFYRNWINSNSSNSNNETTVPTGSFVNPLEFLGSCRSSYSLTPDLYCLNRICEKRFNQTDVCTSSNQCLSGNCGDISITNITNLESESNPNSTLYCVNDYSIWRFLRSTNNSTTSSTLAALTIIFFTLFVLSTLCCYAKKVMRKQREEYMQRSGEGGLRRGGSLLSTINRSNSVRTLPPYTAVSDPPNQTDINPGIFSTLTNFLFPGELPPPYEDENDGSEDHNIRRFTNLNFINDIQNIDESREMERGDESDREDHTTIEVRDGGEEETPVALSMNTPNDNNGTSDNPSDDTTNDNTNEKNGKNIDTLELKSIEKIARVPTNEINALNFRFTHVDNVAADFDEIDFDNIADDQPGSGFYFILACFIIIGIIFQTHNTTQNPSNSSIQELRPIHSTHR
ncbi:5494_t:CDS:2 [Diversispora eburnea]|uniref:5494_t:CDS:1 n=1 Tax=Diversispora eburnea TaxID=1213867 RepID=A0A9N9F2N1_9GLOM|nr:5494_t:CDS:2 [Diversispora eburnea]